MFYKQPFQGGLGRGFEQCTAVSPCTSRPPTPGSLLTGMSYSLKCKVKGLLTRMHGLFAVTVDMPALYLIANEPKEMFTNNTANLNDEVSESNK